MWHKIVPSIDHFRVFGTHTYCHIPKQKRQKWDIKSHKGVFVGYSNQSKGYRIYFPDTGKIKICRDVEFHDELNKSTCVKDNIENNGDFLIQILTENQEQDNVELIEERNVSQNSRNDTESESEYDSATDDVFELDENLSHNRRSGYFLRNRHTAMIAESDEPQNYTQAIRSDNKVEWKKAMEDEYSSLIRNNTWELVEKPMNKKLLSCKWVFKIKRDAQGEINRYKARLVVRGCMQKKNIDFTETFSPVVRFETIRILLSLVVSNSWEMQQFDSDFANDTINRKSTSGMVLKLGNNSVIWRSKKQSVVALSTTESEYIAAAEAIKDLIWAKRLLREIFGTIKTPVLSIDNQSSIKLIKNPEFHSRTKHIDKRYHFIRDQYVKGEFEMKFVPSGEQHADIFTKPLGNILFSKAQSDLN